jgi:hypothetical protein
VGDQVFEEHNSARLLACANDYFPMVCTPVLLPGGLRSCMTTFYYFSVDVHGTGWLSFFLHQPMFDYFKRLNMLTVGNGTVVASGTSPASWYNLMLSRLFVVFVLFLYRLSANLNNLYNALILLIVNNSMIYLMDFGIKNTIKCLNF